MTVTSRIHILVVVPGLLFKFVLFQALIIALLYIYARLAPDAYTVQTIMAVAAMYVGFRFIWSYLQWYAMSIRVSSQVLVIQRGILLSRTERIDLTGAEVSVRQGPVDRLLNRGGLYIIPINGEVRYVGKLTEFRRIRSVLSL